MDSDDTRKLTFSQAVEVGLSHYDWLDGQMISQSLREAALASHSASPEKALVSRMTGTFGPLFGGLFPSCVRRSFVGNRLQNVLGLNGCVAYKMTWRRLVTKSNHTIFRLAASARGISDKECSGWPTLTAQDGNGRDRFNQKNGGVIYSVLGLARRFPTLKARDGRTLKGARDRPNRTGGKSLCQEFLDQGFDNGSLNPYWCAWFMGYPKIHAQLAPTDERLSRKSLRNL